MGNSSISVLVVDDHTIMREGLRAYLEKDTMISGIYEASNGKDAIHIPIDCVPDVVLMDINLPDISGIEATKDILKINDAIKIIALTVHIEKPYVLEMMKAGASGFLTKTCSGNELSAAIHKVFDGKQYICDEAVRLVVDTVVNPLETGKRVDKPFLTRRENQILKLIADGNPNKKIAKILGVSVRTVEKHRTNIMDKLNLRTVAELTKYAIYKGIAALY